MLAWEWFKHSVVQSGSLTHIYRQNENKLIFSFFIEIRRLFFSDSTAGIDIYCSHNTFFMKVNVMSS